MLFEKRSVTVIPPDLWRTNGISNVTPTGLTITPDNALNVTSVFQAIRFLSFMVASLPLITYQKTGDDRKRASRHNLYSLLHDAPNPEMTAFDWKANKVSHVLGRGNGFSEIQYDETGKVIALWPLNPAKMELARSASGELRYLYTLPDRFSDRRVLRPDQVLHWRGLTKEGLWGLSVLAMHRNTVALAKAADDYSAAYFGNNAEPGIVVQHPKTLSDTAYQHLQESWEERHMGLSQAHRLAILEEGMTIEKIGFNPEDSQLLETKQYQVIEIARMFGIPPHLLFSLDNATFSNIEHQSLEFVMYHLRPWLMNFEQQNNRSLLLDRERKSGYYTEFLVDSILRGDIAARFNAYSIGLQNGFYTINEVRRLENMNSVPGGDMHYMPLNMTVIGDDGMPMDTPAMDPNAEPNTPASNMGRSIDVQPILLDAVKRILKREENEYNNALKRFGFNGDAEKFKLWTEQFYKRDLQEFMAIVLMPFVRANYITEVQMQEFVVRYCEQRGTLVMTDQVLDFSPDVVASQLAGESHE